MSLDELLKENCYISKRMYENLDFPWEEQKIIKHNRHFIVSHLKEYQSYFDQLFETIDPNIKLDLEQRIAILTDEDYNLIIAGAGSGKTTTMMAKIKYLIDICHIPSDQILAICFARKNKEELDEKLNKVLKLNVPTTTFHGLGKKIIFDASNHKSDIATEATLNSVISDYLKHDIYKDPVVLEQMLNYLICQFHMDPKIKDFPSLEEYHQYRMNATYETVKSNLSRYNERIIQRRLRYRKTIESEVLRSDFEVKIANFLFLNGLSYQYEQRYHVLTEKGSIYHPDFTVTQGENRVIIEASSTNDKMESDLYKKPVLQKYCHELDLKKAFVRQNGDELIILYQNYQDGRSFTEHLRESLEALGFTLSLKDQKTIYYELLNTNVTSYYYPFIDFVTTFLLKCKTNEIEPVDLEKQIITESNSRTKDFLKNVVPIYKKYQALLNEKNLIDFEDMINLAKNILKDKNVRLPYHYQYIIIDEYQDISAQRFALVKGLSALFQSKIVAVGDDWQAIFGFAGSNVGLFTRFKEEMGYGEILKIQTTYRNAQELIDVAGEFIQKDTKQITKSLRSNKHIEKPVVILSFDDKQFEKGKGIQYHKALAIVKAIGKILEEKKDARILLIGRYRFDMDQLYNTEFFRENTQNRVKCTVYPDVDLNFFTVHRSKGLEYDYVIVINAINSNYGFPSKVVNDPIFALFDREEDRNNMAYAEERRLFYVAMTRTKNKVFLIVPKSKPSPFVLEIQDNIHVEFMDDAVVQYQHSLKEKTCPWCHAYLKKQFFPPLNQEIYLCPTEVEICGFKTVDLSPMIPLYSCPSCLDGYLVYKGIAKNNNLILGCSHYSKEDPNSCHHLLFLDPSLPKNRKKMEKEIYQKVTIK